MVGPAPALVSRRSPPLPPPVFSQLRQRRRGRAGRAPRRHCHRGGAPPARRRRRRPNHSLGGSGGSSAASLLGCSLIMSIFLNMRGWTWTQQSCQRRSMEWQWRRVTPWNIGTVGGSVRRQRSTSNKPASGPDAKKWSALIVHVTLVTICAPHISSAMVLMPKGPRICCRLINLVHFSNLKFVNSAYFHLLLLIE